MGVCCDLEVDVNGEGIFMVDKQVLSSYSGGLSRLFGKSAETKTNLKVIFYDFPGGAEIFELFARSCYNNGSIEISPSNLTLLHSAAQYMEMNKSVSGSVSLMKQMEESLEEISCWTWSDLLLALKRHQDSPLEVLSSTVVQKCVDNLVERLALAAETSPCTSMSSPDSSGFRISCDSRSTESLKTSCSRSNWWFEDLLALNQNLIELVVNSMVSRKFDHGTISKFLFHYQKSKCLLPGADEKCKVMETIIGLLYSLDHWSISYKSLLGILRVSLNLNICKSSRSRLETMVGVRMDEATLDNLLIPSPIGGNYLYDVNLVLRFLRSFLNGGLPKISNDRVTGVASLLDLYLAEVAPDPCLKPAKFIALATALPDSCRDSYDGMYHAMDMYLEVHTDLSEEEIFNICSALNYEKLSPEACIRLSRNEKFPSRTAVQAILSQQVKLKTSLHNGSHPKSCSSSPSKYPDGGTKGRKDEPSEQIVLYAGKLDVTAENEKLKAHLQGMQWRVTELEKVCHKLQTQMAKMMKTKSSSNINAKSLPKLCS